MSFHKAIITMFTKVKSAVFVEARCELNTSFLKNGRVNVA